MMYLTPIMILPINYVIVSQVCVIFDGSLLSHQILFYFIVPSTDLQDNVTENQLAEYPYFETGLGFRVIVWINLLRLCSEEYSGRVILVKKKDNIYHSVLKPWP
jgi:hypothetical protein